MISEVERRELVRKAVLEYLAPRIKLSFDAGLLLQRLTGSRVLDFNATEEEVEGALAFLESSQWIKAIPSRFGKRIFYQATAAGVLAIEQGELE